MADDRAPLMSESATTSQSDMSTSNENESAVSVALSKFVENVVEEMERKLEKYERIAQPGGRPELSKKWDLSKYIGQVALGGIPGAVAFAEGMNYSSAVSQGSKIGEVFGEKYFKLFRGAGQRAKTKLVTFALGDYILDSIELRRFICEAAGRVFEAFEYQIMEINKQDPMVYQKLADIIARRMLFSLKECKESIKNDEDLVRTLSIGAVFGDFEAKGCEINSEHKRDWYAGSMLSKAGIYDGRQFYTNRGCKTDKYGYRKPLKDEVYNTRYKVDNKPAVFNYSYVLTTDKSEKLVKEIYNEINEQDPIVAEQKIKEYASEICDVAERKQNLDRASMALLEKCFSNTTESNNKLDKITESTLSTAQKIEPTKSNLQVVREHQDKNIGLTETIIQVMHRNLSNFNNIEESLSGATENVQKLKDHILGKRIFCIGNPTENFVGRTVELGDIKGYFDAGRKCLIISGEDGSGRAELARKVAADSFNEEMSNALWFDAHDIIGLKDSFYMTAKEIDVQIYDENDKKERSIQDIVSDIYRKTESRKTLVVFNDVREYMILRKFLPRQRVPDMENIHVLITTRQAALITERQSKFPVIELGKLKEGQEYVKNSLGNCAIPKETAALCRLLNWNPLALSLAVGSLKLDDCKIRNYLHKLKERTDGREWNIENILRETVQIALDTIRENKSIGCRALDLLKIMTCLSPTLILSERLFNGLVKDRDQLAAALNLLEKLGLIRVDYKTISLHRTIQAVLQQLLRETHEMKSYLKTCSDVKFLWNYRSMLEHTVPASHIVQFLKVAVDFKDITHDFFKRDENISLLVLEYLAEGDLHLIVAKIFEHLDKQSDTYQKYKQYTLRVATKLESINVIKILEPDNLKWIYFFKVLKAWKVRETDALRSFLESMVSDRESFINTPIEDLRQSVLIEDTNFYTWDVINEAHGKPPLILAVSLGNMKLLQILVEAEADVAATYERVGEKRKSALYVAVEKNFPMIVCYLLDKRCIVEDDDSYPFHLAAERGYEQIVDIFLDRSINCEIQNNMGQTPLHLAAMSGHLQIVQKLKDNGGEVNACDSDGHAPIYYAMLNEKNDVREYLEKLQDPQDPLT